MTRLDAPLPGVELVRRGRYLFVLNRGDEPATVGARGTELLSGNRAEGSVTVPAGGAAVVREDET